MSGEALVAAAACALALVLPVAAMRRREIEWGKASRMAVIWVCLFALAMILAGWMGLNA